jgi:hypothetical protein
MANAFHINATSAIISVLQNELKGTSIKIVMVSFDLLYLNVACR